MPNAACSELRFCTCVPRGHNVGNSQGDRLAHPTASRQHSKELNCSCADRSATQTPAGLFLLHQDARRTPAAGGSHLTTHSCASQLAVTVTAAANTGGLRRSQAAFEYRPATPSCSARLVLWPWAGLLRLRVCSCAPHWHNGTEGQPRASPAAAAKQAASDRWLQNQIRNTFPATWMRRLS
jgi:hypothetical protein